MNKSILLLNGPNLNLLGQREPEIYGSDTLADIEKRCIAFGEEHGLRIHCAQDNSEGVLVDHIQKAMKGMDAIVINPGAYSHTSVAIRDALAASGLPVFEVHISNIHAREEFRHFSYVSGVAVGVICGMGVLGYELALRAVVDYFNKA